MEYCNGGDLGKEIWDRYTKYPKLWVSEKNVWRTFYCLVKNLLVMEAGVEDLDQRPEDPENQEWRPLIHLDIKPVSTSPKT